MSALIYTVFANRDNARNVATQLLGEKLIACANILGEVEALFEWDGERGSGQEVGVVFKTHADCLDRAVERLEQLHPYDTPAILGWKADTSGTATSTWLAGLVA